MATDRPMVPSPSLDSPDRAPFAMAPTYRLCGWALGRFALFAILFTVALWLLSYLTRSWKFSHFAETALVGNMIGALSALSATWIMSKLEKRSWLEYGLAGWHRWRLFLVGSMTAFLLLALQLGLTRVTSEFRFGTVASDQTILRSAGLYAALFLAVSIFEESLWRGYALASLSQGISFWPATMVLSAIFGLVHLKHATESPLGIISAALFGIIFAYSFRRTHSLWFAFGFHAIWNYAQGFIFGVPVSGVLLGGSLLHPVLGGPAEITGGKVGPEGSWWILLTLVLLLVVVRWLPIPPTPPPSDEPDATPS